MCVLILSAAFSGTFLVLRIQQHFINVRRFSSKIPFIRVRFVESNWNFRDTFSKTRQSSNLMIIILVGAEFLRADGRTDRYDKDNSRFPYFCERALKETYCFVSMATVVTRMRKIVPLYVHRLSFYLFSTVF